MTEWEPIAQAPKDGTRVITLVQGFKPTIGWWNGKEWTNDQKVHSDPIWEEFYFTISGEDKGYEPTHFMYLPEPPNGVKE